MYEKPDFQTVITQLLYAEATPQDVQRMCADAQYEPGYMLDGAQVIIAALLKLCFLRKLSDDLQANIERLYNETNIYVLDIPQDEVVRHNYELNPEFMQHVMDSVQNNNSLHPAFIILTNQAHFVTVCIVPHHNNKVSVHYFNSIRDTVEVPESNADDFKEWFNNFKLSENNNSALNAKQTTQREGFLIWQAQHENAETVRQDSLYKKEVGRHAAQLICDFIEESYPEVLISPTDSFKHDSSANVEDISDDRVLDDEQVVQNKYYDLSQQIQFSECCGLSVAAFIAQMLLYIEREPWNNCSAQKQIAILQEKMSILSQLAGDDLTFYDTWSENYELQQMKRFQQRAYYNDFGLKLMICLSQFIEHNYIEPRESNGTTVEDVMHNNNLNFSFYTPLTEEEQEIELINNDFIEKMTKARDKFKALQQKADEEWALLLNSEEGKQYNKHNAWQEEELIQQEASEQLARELQEIEDESARQNEPNEQTYSCNVKKVSQNTTPLQQKNPHENNTCLVKNLLHTWQSYSALSKVVIIVSAVMATAAVTTAVIIIRNPDILQKIYDYCYCRTTQRVSVDLGTLPVK